MGQTLDTGRAGEDVAERYLVRRGWTTVTRNWHGGGGEIDLIAHRRGILAVCEVKTRASASALDEVLTAAQRDRIMRAASAFLARSPQFRSHLVRFDLIAVERRPLRWRVRHMAGAFVSQG